MRHWNSLFLLLVFVFSWALSVISKKCGKKGWIAIAGNNECVPCPEGFYCTDDKPYPQKCPTGTVALRGSSQCCLSNSTCSAGFAVSANENCQCVKVECPYYLSDYEKNVPPRKMVFDKYMGTAGGIVCKDKVIGCEEWYDQCPPNMIQFRDNCVCWRRTRCMDPELSSMQYWYSEVDMSFVCLEFDKL